MQDAAPEAASSRPHPKRWRILAVVALGTLMGPVDGSVVNIALPVITRSFGATLPVAEWVAMAYLLVMSSLLLLWGRLGDLHGHRRTYLAGLGTFTAGSLLCGAAPGIGWLIAFRAVQAVGAGLMMSAGPAIITEVFPSTERGRALGFNAVAVAAGLSIGPVLGGLLVEHLGWRSIFYINLPVGVAVMAWAARILPPPSRTRAAAFDVPGAVTLFGALLSLLLALSHGEAWGWSSPATLTLAAVGCLGLGGFVAIERRAEAPMVDLALLRDRVFVLANLSGLINYMAQFSVTFLLPFFLQFVLGLAPDRAGLVMLGFPVAVLFVAPAAGYLSDRFGSRWLAMTGMAIVALGVLGMSRLGPGSSGAEVFWKLTLIGLGAGLFQAPNNSAIMGAAPKERLGMAGGMLASTRTVGMVLGIAVSGAIFAARAGERPDVVASSPDVFLAGMHAAMGAGAAIALLGTLTSFAARPGSPARPGPTRREEAARGPARPVNAHTPCAGDGR